MLLQKQIQILLVFVCPLRKITEATALTLLVLRLHAYTSENQVRLFEFFSLILSYVFSAVLTWLRLPLTVLCPECDPAFDL